MNDKLLPCPFCGGIVSVALGGDGITAYWFITRGQGKNACKCRVFMESKQFDKDFEITASDTKDKLIAAWNRRTPDIVRCGECQYGENCTCIVCESGNTVVCQKQHKHVEKNHFCSYGQRRLESNQH